ncbi:hypothetical protein OGAPHI_003611 [Ogataea philodendri]|uniref:Uncharacterized protein n=1 Tax=Ogataea philodendri TaxID=1378263 RepID=A0A9P8P5P6_9ASCO|nr:uncharacterized protein OGAPHI_003611 [Ogataea philodendri]KAH3665427.1 hypothetical protein OGAPHI_003611 [Ogataea philodendri]
MGIRGPVYDLTDTVTKSESKSNSAPNSSCKRKQTAYQFVLGWDSAEFVVKVPDTNQYPEWWHQERNQNKYQRSA